jgi:hypothetical protein
MFDALELEGDTAEEGITIRSALKADVKICGCNLCLALLLHIEKKKISGLDVIDSEYVLLLRLGQSHD